MKNILSALLVAAFLACAVAQGMAQEKEDFSQLFYLPSPLGHFDFEQDPKFSMIVLEIKYWIVRSRYYDEDPSIDRLKRWNHFCAVGYVFPVDPDEKQEFPLEKEVVVYWKEERVFTRWHGGNPELAKQNFHYANSLFASPELSVEDTVPRKDLDKIMLGTHQLVKEGADSVVADCEKHGNQYIIGPFMPPSEEH